MTNTRNEGVLMHWGTDGEYHEGSLDSCSESDCQDRRHRIMLHHHFNHEE